MFAKLLAAGGLVAGLVVAGAPVAQAEDASCTDDLVTHVNSYYYSYQVLSGWVTVNGLDVSVNGGTIVADTKWNSFVTQDYAGYLAAGAVNFVNCVV